MHCIVTAGPTYEPIDGARRLTNFSSGRTGTELANFLSSAGQQVTLLLGETASHRGPTRAAALLPFSTTSSLQALLASLASDRVGAVFHAAAVSDFAISGVFRRGADGTLTPLHAGKLPSTPGERLWAELVPTPKVINRLRDLFPNACIVGWKYEVEGTTEHLLELAREQIARARVNATVVNGPAYGEGFGLARKGALRIDHQPDARALFQNLLNLMQHSDFQPA
jgi:phosphopantothenoylcysteine decarboxylase/phosphopantothenate--cysteine ligase